MTGFFQRSRRGAEFAYPRARSLVTRPRLRKLMFRDVMEHGERVLPGEAAHMLQGMVECSIFSGFIDAVVRDGPAADMDQVACPALIAWAENDRIFPVDRYAEAYGAVPGVEVVRLPGCGHIPMWDAPDLVTRTIANFAARNAEGHPALAS